MTGLKGKTFLFVLLGLMLNFTLLFVLVMTGKFAFLFVSEPTVKYYIRLVVKVCALKSENGFIIEPIHTATAFKLFNIHWIEAKNIDFGRKLFKFKTLLNNFGWPFICSKWWSNEQLICPFVEHSILFVATV